MVKRLSRSYEERSVEEIYQTNNILTKSLYFTFKDRTFTGDLFITETEAELLDIRDKKLDDVDKYTCLDIISLIEALFTLDFYNRCENKLKDDLSRDFRSINKKNQAKNKRVSFEEDILNTWLKYNPSNALITKIKQIFQYRHWLAHGRYWLLKINRTEYDFNYLYMIYWQITRAFELMK